MKRFAFETATRSHVGNVRKRNEDSHLARPEIGLWVVADGMGGHEHGDRASQLVIEKLRDVPQPANARELFRHVRDAIEDCHKALYTEYDNISGSTVVILMAYGADIAIAWAGDSRLYRLRHGRLEQLTTDHNLAQEMIERGMDEEEAQASPLANRLTRAVGIPEPLELAVDQDSIEPGDIYILCSDGVTGEIDDTTMLSLIDAKNLDHSVDTIVDTILSREAKDNLTVILVRAYTPATIDSETTVPKIR